MTLLLPALAVTFTAFSIWLTVRIINRRERWAKWTLVGVIGLPVLYAASFGPACWLATSRHIDKAIVQQIYRPIIYAAAIGHGPIRLRRAIMWWGSIGIPRGRSVIFVWHEPRPFYSFPRRQIVEFRGDGRFM